MAWTTAEQARFKTLENQVLGMLGVIETIAKDLKTKVSSADMIDSEKAQDQLRLANSDAIAKIQEQLATIVLPEDTRFYLEASEVESFKANFNRLQAMLAEVNRLYKNIVSFTTTNS